MEVLSFYKMVNYDLSRIKPDGKIVHRLANVKTFFGGSIDLYEGLVNRSIISRNETFSQLRERNVALYKNTIRYTLRAINDFGISIHS
jgi:hypothetical protein